MSIIAYVGIDAHESSLSICAFTRDSLVPVFETQVPNERTRVCGLFRRLSQEYDLRCCYEASGLGYVLHRWLANINVSCAVIAPSLIPKKPGNHIKTDKRDACELAKLFRSGHLTSVIIPSEEEEGARALVRLRGSLIRDIVSWKNQINKFLGGQHLQFSEGSRWTEKHWLWLRSLKFAAPNDFIWSEMLAMLDYKVSRLKEVDNRICAYAQKPQYKEKVAHLCCFRGVATLTAMTLLTEIIDFDRFKNPKALMAYLGLVPGEHSSGDRRRQGQITKAGNSRCRRALVEAAWKYIHRPSRSLDMIKRQEGAPAWIVAHSWKAQHRLHKKYQSIVQRGKDRKTAVVAVARELVGFLWAVMVTTNAASPAAPKANVS